jgi:hypothetical protein
VAKQKNRSAFTGTSLRFTIISKQINALNIIIDGKVLPKIVLPKNIRVKTTYLIATDLPQGLHTAWVTKATEYTYGCGKVTLFDRVIDSNASIRSPSLPKKRRIEVMGDASFSSIGVEGLLIVGDSNHLTGGDYTKHYDFKTPMDVVILSAGGSDFLGASGSAPLTDRTKFVTTYTNWLLRICGYDPSAMIAAAMSLNANDDDRIHMLSGLTDAGKQAQIPNGPNTWAVYDHVANAGGYGWGCRFEVACGAHGANDQSKSRLVISHPSSPARSLTPWG